MPQVSATTNQLTPSAAGAGITASAALVGGNVQVSWQLDPGPEYLEIVIERRDVTTGSPFVMIATAVPDLDTSIIDDGSTVSSTGFAEGHVYEWRVTADY